MVFDGERPEIVVGPASTPERRWPIAPSGRYPARSADGREVLFTESSAIYAVPIDPRTANQAAVLARSLISPRE